MRRAGQRLDARERRVAADAAHLAGAAIRLGGLPCLAAVLLRAPRALPDAGRALASAALRRFSRVALCSVAVVALTGLARMAGELSSPTELWSTAYGRDLLLKTSLLLPILVLAGRQRQLVARLGGGWSPTTAPLRSVARTVELQLAIGAGIVVVAALLVAEAPAAHECDAVTRRCAARQQRVSSRHGGSPCLTRIAGPGVAR